MLPFPGWCSLGKAALEIEWWQAAVLGFVQGGTEFLPVSSSAHLVLVPRLFHWPDPGLAFDVALHVGTLLALVIYFRREWMGMVRLRSENLKLLTLLLLGTVPGALAGLLLQDLAETSFRSPRLIAFTLAAFGVVLWAVDGLFPSRRRFQDLSFGSALFIGLGQALALVPGVSRSGATMTAARLLGYDRPTAARFSFLLSAPVILGAGLLELRRIPGETFLHPAFLAGVGTAALSSLLAIAFLLSFLQRSSFRVFALYRMMLGAAILFLVGAGRL